MLSSFTFVIGQNYGSAFPVKKSTVEKITGGMVLGTSTKTISEPLPDQTQVVTYPPLQSDFVPEDESTESYTKETIKNANGSFTVVEKVLVDDKPQMKVTELAPTGEVVKETYYPISN